MAGHAHWFRYHAPFLLFTMARSKKLLYWFGAGMILLAVLFAFVKLRWSSPSSNFPVLRTKKAYFITQTYGGQMTRAIRNMMVQQCWAGAVQNTNISIIEPFSVESQLLQMPRIWNELGKGFLDYAARFSEYYDMANYNMQSMGVGSAHLISWEEFVHSAPRVAIVVKIPTYSCKKVFAHAADQCLYSASFRAYISALTDMGFIVIRNICLKCNTLHKLEDLLFSNSNNSEVSVFINSWRNFQFVSSFIQVPGHCKLAEKPESSNFLIPSSLVMHHSKFYVDNFIRKKSYVGIMLRIERFLTLAASGRSSESIESCLNKTLIVYDKLMSLKRNVGAYITVDIGKYGSGIMQKEGAVAQFGKGSIGFITNLVESVFKHIYNATVTLEDWENTFVNTTGGKLERGYIAMLQRNIASQSDCLILMGGGSFQQVAGFQYLNNKKGAKPCIHTVCVSNSFKHIFD